MNRGERITQYWLTPTPGKVGPGAYNLASVPHKAHATVPFNQSQQRTLNASLQEQSPGPGTYGLLLKPALRGVKFAYGSARESLFPQSHQPSPGPGTYSPDALHPRYSRRRVPRPLSFPTKPSAVSIPSSVRETTEVSPMRYFPNLTVTKPTQRNYSFGKPRKPRSLQPSPGPGAYNPFRNGNQQSTRSWVFLSNARRLAAEKASSPGPGYYESSTLLVKERIRQDAFGSAAERDIPLGKDPHRPYMTSQEQTPPVGYYSTQEQLARVAQLREKYVVPSIVPQRAPFGTSVVRFSSPSLSQLRPSEKDLTLG